MAIDRSLPAEQAVLGAMLIDPDCVGPTLAKVREEDFLTETNRMIFRAIRALFRAGEPVDGVTVRGRVGQEHGQYLLELMEATPTSANVLEYAAIMHDQATVQRIRDLCADLDQAPTLEATRPLIAQLTSLLDDTAKLDIWTMRDVLEYFQRRQTDEEARPEYITVGIKDVDEGSFTEPGDVMVIAGEPSSGKTAFGLLAAFHMARKHRVGFFSLETKNEKLADRLIAGNLGIDFTAIKRSTMTEEDWRHFAEGSAGFMERDLRLIPCSGMTASQIQAVTRACGFDVIFIDYAQLLRPELSDRMGSAAQMADVSRSLHTFAQRHGVLVVELLQLSRQENKGKWREPNMHDLKETGQWEQDADIVMMLYSPNPASEYDPNTTRFLKIAKNKEGRRGIWPLHFDGSLQRFTPLAGPDGKSLVRKFRDKGELAKAMRRSQVQGQQSFQEIKPSGDEPF